jgi:hypothetical protein
MVYFILFFIKIGNRRAGGMTQVVEHLPSKCEALNSTPVQPKKKKLTN